MDENKAQKLRDIGYAIGPTCGQCVWGCFSSPAVAFGECLRHEYEHRKHTEDRRYLSVYRHGNCPDFQRDERRVLGEVHGFKEFIK